MRALLSIAALAVALSACSGPCDELASRLCDCPAPGISSDTCRRQASDTFNRSKPSDSQCSAWLDSCKAPENTQFCDYVNSRCGKAQCGVSQESPGQQPGEACGPATSP